jgi:peptidoglycan/LPS O-acetylase OafA/YrhL
MQARHMIRLDAAFEAVLGAVLVAGVAVGWLGSDDFPSPATTGVAAGLGIILLALAAALWRLSSVDLTVARIATLATVNAATALIAALWVLTAEGFSTPGAILVSVTAVVLGVLAGVQARLAGRRPSASHVQH